jgi:hypothetical protein
MKTTVCTGGPASVVGIATGYGLVCSGIEFLWEARFSAPVQAGPGAHPASCTMGTESFLRVRSDRGVTLTPHPLLLPWSWKSRAIPLLFLWAVRPVQSLSACTRVHFTFTFGHERVELYLYSPYGPYGLYRASVPVQGRTLPLPLPNISRQTNKSSVRQHEPVLITR